MIDFKEVKGKCFVCNKETRYIRLSSKYLKWVYICSELCNQTAKAQELYKKD